MKRKEWITEYIEANYCFPSAATLVAITIVAYIYIQEPMSTTGPFKLDQYSKGYRDLACVRTENDTDPKGEIERLAAAGLFVRIERESITKRTRTSQ